MSTKFYTNVKQYGNNFLVRGYEDGQEFRIKEKFSPKLYVATKNKTPFKTLDEKYVKEIQPGSVRECKDFMAKYKDVEGFEIYGNDRFTYQYISETYPEETINFDIKEIKLYTIDIEVASENGFPDQVECIEEVLLITIQDYNTKKIITWGVRPFYTDKPNVTFIHCTDEYDLLNRFLAYWVDNTPDVITGWNCTYYDIPYICGRIEKILGEKKLNSLSPWKSVYSKEVIDNNKVNVYYDIGGVSQLDYMLLYKKFTYVTRESYSLDHIASVELGETKLDHTQFETFKEFYSGDFIVSPDEDIDPTTIRYLGKLRSMIYQRLEGKDLIEPVKIKVNFASQKQIKFLEENIKKLDLGILKYIYVILDGYIKKQCWDLFTNYNIIDVELVDKLEDKLKLVELAITMAYDAKVNYEDVFYQVRMWDVIIYNYLKKRNVVVPKSQSTVKKEKYPGAYVKEPIPGKYDYVVNFDLDSLYPHIIMQYSISPETLVPIDEINDRISQLEAQLANA